MIGPPARAAEFECAALNDDGGALPTGVRVCASARTWTLENAVALGGEARTLEARGAAS
jgi:hypothetical protein